MLSYRGPSGEAVQHADFAGEEVFVGGSGSDPHWLYLRRSAASVVALNADSTVRGSLRVSLPGWIPQTSGQAEQMGVAYAVWLKARALRPPRLLV